MRKGLLIVASAVVAAALCVVALYDAATKTDPGLDFHGPEVTAARAKATGRLGQELDAFAARANGLHLVASGSSDYCEKNQYNWKVKQPNAYDCTLEVVRVYTFAGDFRGRASRIGDALVAGDCPAGTITRTESVLRDYYDREHGTRAWDGTPYGPAHLPDSDGVCGPPGTRISPERDNLHVIGWIGTRPPAAHLTLHVRDVPRPCVDRLCTTEPIDLAATLRDAPAGDQWAVIVASVTVYHSEPWD